MKFEKVNKECFHKDAFNNGFDDVDEVYENIVMPERKTELSSGYDFRTPFDLELYPDDRRVVPTGIKAHMGKGEVLILAVRSSVGIKDGVQFSNGIGVIDVDYYGNAQNDGDIMLALWNSSSKLVRYKAGDRIAQGMFFKFDTTEDDNASGIRTGGVGSTGKE